jgi:hypothetical protein
MDQFIKFNKIRLKLIEPQNTRGPRCVLRFFKNFS